MQAIFEVNLNEKLFSVNSTDLTFVDNACSAAFSPSGVIDEILVILRADSLSCD